MSKIFKKFPFEKTKEAKKLTKKIAENMDEQELLRIIEKSKDCENIKTALEVYIEKNKESPNSRKIFIKKLGPLISQTKSKEVALEIWNLIKCENFSFSSVFGYNDYQWSLKHDLFWSYPEIAEYIWDNSTKYYDNNSGNYYFSYMTQSIEELSKKASSERIRKEAQEILNQMKKEKENFKKYL